MQLIPQSTVWLATILLALVFSLGLYFVLRLKKKQMIRTGATLEDERMFEPFYGAGKMDRFRVIVSVFLLGSLPLVVVFLVSQALPHPWILLVRGGSILLLLALSVFYAIILFDTSRELYNRYELIIIPSGFFFGMVLASLFASSLEFGSVALAPDFRYVAIVVYSVIALVFGIKLLLVATRTIYDKQARAEDEIEFASEIQRQFLRDRHLDTAEMEGYGVSRAARQVGGDFMHLGVQGSGPVVAAVGDVSGHSFGAGLIMSMLVSKLEAHLFYKDAVGGLFERLNHALRDQPRRHIFATAACVSVESGTARLWNAGHMPPLTYCDDTGELTEHRHPGLALGLAASASFKALEIQLKSRDSLVLYSDGLVETRDQNGEVRDESHFKSVVESVLERATDCETAAKSIIRESVASDHSPHSEDDLTVIVLRMK